MSRVALLVGLAAFINCYTTGFSQVAPAGVGKLYCVDARQLGFSQKLLLASLQALANSNAPVLFMIQRDEDLSWRAAMEARLGKTFETISAEQALSNFGTGAPQVIYDSGRRWSLSIATTVAGIHRALLTDHELEGRAVAFDCHSQWTNKVEAYHWALGELLPKCRQDRLVYLDESIAAMRDFAIQQQLFVLNLDPLNDPRDIKLLEEILGKFLPQTTVFGWATGAYARKARNQNDVMVEFALVSRLSRRGLNLVASDYDGNLSFYDRTAPHIGPLKQSHLDRHMKWQAGKRYVMLVNSDGDNLQYDLGRMRAHWQEADRPKIPMAWTIAPQLADVGPAVIQTYYQEAAARGGWDEFVSGASGAGYMNPGSMIPVHLRQFIQTTRRLCDAADLSALTILDKGDRPRAQVAGFINAYASAKFDGLWFIAMPRYAGVAGGGTAFLNERFRLGPRNAAEIARQVKTARTGGPFIMIYVDGWETTAQTLREFVAGLDDSCVLVSSTEMADLMRQWASAYAKVQEISSRPDADEGLFPVSNEDGVFAIVKQDGVRCWQVPKSQTMPLYFYLGVDGFFPAAIMEIELEYFDAGSGDIALDYDSTDVRAPLGGAYKRHPVIIHRSNKGGWQKARFQVNDGYFGSAQNGGADFRFYNGGDDLLIRAVHVRRVF
jgi:hypothetical protein